MMSRTHVNTKHYSYFTMVLEMMQLVVDDTFPCREKPSEMALESNGVGTRSSEVLLKTLRCKKVSNIN